MKHLILPALLAFFLTGLSADATAQTPSWQHQLYVNAGLQFVTESPSDALGTGFGIDGGYYYRADRAFFIGFTAGLHQFSSSGEANRTVIPLNATAKYNFSLTGIQPYIGADGGPFVSSNGDSGTKFGIAPQFGLRIPVARGIDIDLTLKYSVIFTDSDNLTYVGTNGGFAYIFDRANIEYQ
ncbi:MAG: hypothetical protein BRD42_08100 [Bacteroidetes bacterium QS_3_64_15]|nr:MAG: hypothetical protein BRD42_08100 [Bacteroidetes bacterium QS_3_64_15]